MTPVWRTEIELGGVDGVTVLGVDAEAAGRVVDPRPDTLGDPWSEITARLAGDRDLGGGLDLPGDPRCSP